MVSNSKFGSKLLTALAVVGILSTPTLRGVADAAPAAKTHAPSAKADSPSAKGNGMLLTQQCPFSNVYTVSLTPDAIRIDHRTGDFYIISKAPDWRIYVIRPKDKLISSVAHKFWINSVHLRSGSWTSQLEKPTKIVHSITPEDKRITYTFAKAVAANSAELMFRDKQTSNDGNNHSEMVCIIYPNSDKSGPVIGRLQNLPAVQGIPYSAARYFDNGVVNGAIRTSILKRNQSFDPAIYKIPTGLKEVTFDRKFVISSAQQENSEALLEEFMAK